MKCIVSYACVLSVLIAGSLAAPIFPPFGGSSFLQIGGSAQNGTSLSEVLSSFDIPAALRTLNSAVKLVSVVCPPCSQILDNVIQNVTTQAFRIFGRAILRNGLGVGGGSSSSSSGSDGGARVSVVLPTYPPDDTDYDDDEATNAASNAELIVSTSTNPPSSPAIDESNTIAKRQVRVVRDTDAADEDQQGAESAPEPADDLSNLDDDADRDKRLVKGGFGFGGSGGGSGNFLFDIIRLIAGSGATEESDEKAGPGGVAEVDVKSVGQDITHGEGIPGPITRLFVVANRGLANLIQDLILRLAQTSERIVNFKARLVTSLI